MQDILKDALKIGGSILIQHYDKIEDIKVKKVTETKKEEIKIKTTKSKAVKTKVVRKKGKNGTA